MIAVVVVKCSASPRDGKCAPTIRSKASKRNYEAKRKRYLSADELNRLLAAMAAHPDQRVANIFRLLLLSGARRGEVLGACVGRTSTWPLVNGSSPARTTKQKTDHEVPLSAPARQLLADIAQTAELVRRGLPEFVFPRWWQQLGTLSRSKRAWRQICQIGWHQQPTHSRSAPFSFASQLASGACVSLPLIGALLGHIPTRATTASLRAPASTIRSRRRSRRSARSSPRPGNGNEPTPPVDLPRGRGRRR